MTTRTSTWSILDRPDHCEDADPVAQLILVVVEAETRRKLTVRMDVHKSVDPHWILGVNGCNLRRESDLGRSVHRVCPIIEDHPEQPLHRGRCPKITEDRLRAGHRQSSPVQVNVGIKLFQPTHVARSNQDHRLEFLPCGPHEYSISGQDVFVKIARVYGRQQGALPRDQVLTEHLFLLSVRRPGFPRWYPRTQPAPCP